MHSFEAKIEKMKPAFEKIASNPYVSAIRDGFIAAMPIILFSSMHGDFIGARRLKMH